MTMPHLTPSVSHVDLHNGQNGTVKAATNSTNATRKTRTSAGTPPAQGLYDPRNERDACGVGFIAHMKGQKSHQVVENGLKMLENLTHRGAVGADPLMGDGAGILVQIPDRFFREEMARQGIDLPQPGHYAVGYLFMPRDAEFRAHIEEII
jgi:glutamate synthase (NADPH/NADH) large chain